MYDFPEKNKNAILDGGVQLMREFCIKNDVLIPEIVQHERSEWRFKVCAYYRRNIINICLDKCSFIGKAGMSWSHPGYTADMTPFGVVIHELGHHVDMLRSTVKDRYRGDFSQKMRKHVKEDPITSYCPDDGEWFAEMFRVFVSNPDLIKAIRPKTYLAMTEYFEPVINLSWQEVLQCAPQRTIKACQSKVMKAEKF